MRKILAVVFSVMILLATAPQIGFIKEVSAAQPSVCEETVDGNFCVESEDVSFTEYGGCLEGRLRTGQNLDNLENEAGGACQVGTCIPDEGGQCSSNKFRIECEDDRGSFDLNANPLECNVACCKTNAQCGLKEKNYCDFVGGDYISGITDYDTCNLQCAGQEVGCFKPADSPDCSYGIREDVEVGSGTFNPGTYCRDVSGCETYNDANDLTYLSCGTGDVQNDEERNVYRFDRKGNREELIEACDLDYRCEDPDDGDINTVDASCVTTSCVVEAAGFYPNQFRSGEALCVNVLSGHFSNEKISKGLHNYILTCADGEITVNDDDDFRNLRCEESVDEVNENRFTARFSSNEWLACHGDCGDPDNYVDVLAYVPGLGPPLVNLIGNSCDGGGWPPGGDECSSLGDCSGGPLSTADYDGDFLWEPIGSCNPTYPPGVNLESGLYSNGKTEEERCGECGVGGDGIPNVCTKAECNALGDCKLEGGNSAASYGTTGALALGAFGAVVTACQLIKWIPGADLACSSAAAAGFANLGTSGVLFWGAVSTIYGIGAAQNTQEEGNQGEVAKELYKDGQLRLISNLLVAQGLTRIVDLENEILLRDDSVGDWWLSTVPSSAAQLFILTGNLPASWVTALHNVWISSTINSAGEEVARQFAIGTIGKMLASLGFVVNYVAVANSFEVGQCVPETGYDNSNSCELCGPGDGQWFCTEQRCEAIGGGENGWCKYVPFEEGGISDGFCIPNEPGDQNAPFVTAYEVKFIDDEDQVIQEFTSNSKSFEISDLVSQDAIKVDVNLTMNELTSSCGYAKEVNTAYEAADKTVFEYNGQNRFQHGVIDLTETDRSKGDTGEPINYYFKCQDFLGNTIGTSDNSNVLRFTMDERPDLDAPTIHYIDPASIWFPENTAEVDLELIAFDKNGVSRCKYSTGCGINNQTFEIECSLDYNEMSEFATRTNAQCPGLDATCQKFTTNLILNDDWKQSIELIPGDNVPDMPGLSGENTPHLDFYMLGLMCEDGAGNVMNTPEPWSIAVVPGFAVQINEPMQDQEIWNTSINVDVTSSNPTTCQIELEGREENLTTRLSVDHSGIIEDLEGTNSGRLYTMVVNCRDYASNEASSSVSFRVFADTVPPQLLRIWTTSNKLNVLVDEESTCYYSNEDNGFDLTSDDVSEMASNDGFTHFTGISEPTYYIACVDTWDNIERFTVHP